MIRSSCLQKCNRIQLRNSASIVVFHKYLSSRKFRSVFVNTKFSSEFHNRNFSRTKTWPQLSGEQKAGNINANYKILDINAYFSLIITWSICFILNPLYANLEGRIRTYCKLEILALHLLQILMQHCNLPGE